MLNIFSSCVCSLFDCLVYESSVVVLILWIIERVRCRWTFVGHNVSIIDRDLFMNVMWTTTTTKLNDNDNRRIYFLLNKIVFRLVDRYRSMFVTSIILIGIFNHRTMSISMRKTFMIICTCCLLLLVLCRMIGSDTCLHRVSRREFDRHEHWLSWKVIDRQIIVNRRECSTHHKKSFLARTLVEANISMICLLKEYEEEKQRWNVSKHCSFCCFLLDWNLATINPIHTIESYFALVILFSSVISSIGEVFSMTWHCRNTNYFLSINNSIRIHTMSIDDSSMSITYETHRHTRLPRCAFGCCYTL
jgi:hypothetical protein